MSEETAPSITVVCGRPKDARRRCDEVIAVVAQTDGALIGGVPFRLNGKAYRLGRCRRHRHGTRGVSDDDVLVAFTKWRRDRPRGVAATVQLPLGR